MTDRGHSEREYEQWLREHPEERLRITWNTLLDAYIRTLRLDRLAAWLSAWFEAHPRAARAIDRIPDWFGLRLIWWTGWAWLAFVAGIFAWAIVIGNLR